VEAAAADAGFAPEARPFRAHVTLGRWRERAPRPALPEPAVADWMFESLVIYKSELRPQGARHTPRATFRLGVR
jgi:2'-5' RNA ligase